MQRQIRSAVFAAWLIAAGAASWTWAQEKSAGEQVDVPRLNEAFIRAYNDKEWAKAIELGEKLQAADPKNETHLYNLACVYALGGQGDKAVDAFRRAADDGFPDYELAATDPDLDSIRGKDGYKTGLETIKKNSAKMLESFKEKAAQSEPLIIVPKELDAEKPVPAIVALHGFGGSADRFAEAWKPAAEKAGAILILPRAVLPAGSGYQWGTSDQAGILVSAALEKAKSKHKIDAKRIVLTGFSQGGMLSYTLGLRYADQFAAVIPVCGNYNPLALKDAAESKRRLPRFFIMVGGEDIGLNASRQAERELRDAGAKVSLEVYEGVGHEFPKNRDEELEKALKFALGS